MHREYHNWWSKDLQRDMALLCFGHAGRKILVFPTSHGRFFEYEDNKMIAAVADKLDNGELQIYCVDSVDVESWYNTWAHPYWRLQRHLQYERYIINDVFPADVEQELDALHHGHGMQLRRVSRRQFRLPPSRRW